MDAYCGREDAEEDTGAAAVSGSWDAEASVFGAGVSDLGLAASMYITATPVMSSLLIASRQLRVRR